MRPFEFDRFLRDHGFAFEKDGAKHRFYSYRGHQMIVPRGKAIKSGTIHAIKKQIKDIKAGVDPILAADLQKIEIPDTACEPLARKGENHTLLTEDKFELYTNILEFCQGRAGEIGTYTLREVLLFIDYQLPDFNSLVGEAIEKQDLAVLFDLRDALDLVRIHSHQINDAIDDFEALTAPSEPEPIPATPPAPSVQQPVRFITSARKAIPAVNIIQPANVVPPPMASVNAEVAEVVPAPPSTLTSPDPAPASLQKKGLSRRQSAVARILAVFGELPDEDIAPVQKQVTDFLEL